MYTIETVTSDLQFQNMREEWSDLLRNSNSNCIFLTWEWLHSWWRHVAPGGQLFLVTLREGRDLVALAPFVQRPPDLTRLLPSRSLEFLGTGVVGSDYLDIVVRKGRERAALTHIPDWLSAKGLVLSLAQLGPGSIVFGVAEALAGRNWRVVPEKTTVCPFIDLTGHSCESYLQTLSTNHRYNYKRQVRLLGTKFRLNFEQITSEDRREQALDQLWELHNRRWEARGGSEGLIGADVLAFHREVTRLALQQGWLRLFLLSLDDKPVASLYGFMHAGKFSYYQAGFDPAYARLSIGGSMLGLTIQHAIEEGAAEFDMLHGDEPYKFHWARSTRDLFRVEMYPSDSLGLLCHTGVNLSRASRRMARTLLPNGIRDRIAAAVNAESRKGIRSARTD